MASGTVNVGGGGSHNYAISNSIAITVGTSTPTSIASCQLTTKGGAVLLIATGDANPNGSSWNYLRLYRDSTAIGKEIIDDDDSSRNKPFALTTIDTPPAGTYTYSVKAWTGSGSVLYGESGDIEAPTLVAIEL